MSEHKKPRPAVPAEPEKPAEMPNPKPGPAPAPPKPKDRLIVLRIDPQNVVLIQNDCVSIHELRGVLNTVLQATMR